MSDPSKCMTLYPSEDAHATEAVSQISNTKLSDGRRRMSAGTIRVIENWVVALVTLLSATVILVTLLAHRDFGKTPDPASHTSADAVSLGR